MATKQEILKEKLEEYLRTDKVFKGFILDQIQGVTRMNRKAIIRRLWVLQRGLVPSHERRGRKEVYGMRVTLALKEVWEIANTICAERLHPAIEEYVTVLKRDGMWRHDEYTTGLLLAMSIGTMKNRIRGFRKATGRRRGKSTTKPGSLKEIIPIRRGPWENPPPGFGEIDTVAHCGASLGGDYAFSVQYTDIATIWTCLSAQWNKGQAATIRSMERIQRRLPFRLKGLDPDSGSEFINWQMVNWCQQQPSPVTMTRIRPYYKNDHARIEQKQYCNLRQFVGYTRIEDARTIKPINELYDNLEDYINFFLPSVKCLAKEREGSKYRRIYDRPQTAYRRVLAHPDIDPAVKRQLTIKYATLNPKLLKEKIDKMLQQILANTHY